MSVAELNRKRQVVEQFLLGYRCGIDEVETKIRVLRREFASEQSYNPIESFSSRMKALPSLAATLDPTQLAAVDALVARRARRRATRSQETSR